MRGRRRFGAARLPISLSIILLLASSASAAFKNDFSAYPQGARSCLSKADSGSGCTADTVEEMNACLCGNTGNFALAAAACVAKDSPDDLGKVYTTMADACSYSKTPLAVSQKDFLEAGSQGTSGATPTPRP